MEKFTETPELREHGLDRRELLKVLTAAGGGLAAAAFLPDKWLKPVMESGVLPAHAQATCCLVILNLVGTTEVEGNGCHSWGSVEYEDCFGIVGQLKTTLHLDITGFGEMDLTIDIVGDANVGHINWSFFFPGSCTVLQQVPFQMWLSVGGCLSNVLTEKDVLPPIEN